MKKFFELKTPEQLKAISDPLKKRLLEEFSKEPKTAKQVATALGEKPTKLYYHVDFLEKNGLLKLVRKQQNRGTTEKYFRSVANRFVVGKELIELSSKGMGKSDAVGYVLLDAMEDSLKNLRESIEAKLNSEEDARQRPIILINAKIPLSPEQVPEFSEHVQTWIDKNGDKNTEEKALHQVTMVVFPLANETS